MENYSIKRTLWVIAFVAALLVALPLAIPALRPSVSPASQITETVSFSETPVEASAAAQTTLTAEPPTPTLGPTVTPSPSARTSATETPTLVPTETETVTYTPTGIPSATPFGSSTASATPTDTATPVLTPSTTPTATPGQEYISVFGLEFFPEPDTLLDRTQGFEFGVEIHYNTQAPATIAHNVAFWAAPGDVIPECEERRILHDEIFWADQQAFETVDVNFSRRFFFSDRPGFDRLVIRVNVVDAGDDRLIYCIQRVYVFISN